MKLENLMVKDERPINSKIKDALIEVPDEVLLKIVSDYTESNGFAPIYKNTKENIDILKQNGYEVDPKVEDTFAFLTPNRYGGVEGFNEVKEKVDFDNELVPYIENNLTTYQNDLHINDEDEILDEEWLKANWKATKFPTKEARYNNVARLINLIRKQDGDLAYKVGKLLIEYDKNPKIYTYNDLKRDILKLFKENNFESKELSEAEKSELRKFAANAYKKRYGKDLKYANLPESWLSKLDPYLNSGKVEGFKKIVEELSLTEKEKLEKRGLTKETLLEEFENIFGTKFAEDTIRNFAYKNDEDAEKMLSCFEATLNAYEDQKITFEEALGYFKTVRSYPEEFENACKRWYAPGKEEVREKEFERNSDIETGHTNSDIGKQKKRINETVNKIKSSKNEEYISYWEDEFDYYKDLYKNGSLKLEEFLDELEEVAEYCLEKIKASGIEIKEEEEVEEKETDPNEEKELKEIFDEIDSTGITGTNFEEDFKEFYKNLKIEERKKLRKNLLEKFNSDSSYSLDLANSNDVEEELKKFL